MESIPPLIKHLDTPLHPALEPDAMARGTVRVASKDDCANIHGLAETVQLALTASGSQQRIAPLQDVDAAVDEQRCFILEDQEANLSGCLFFRSLSDSTYPGTELDISAYPDPWLVLHSLMLHPDMQGHGLGRLFVNQVVNQLSAQRSVGTIFLDCWAGNVKLRWFYRRAGFDLVGIAIECDYQIAVFARGVGDGKSADQPRVT